MVWPRVDILEKRHAALLAVARTSPGGSHPSHRRSSRRDLAEKRHFRPLGLRDGRWKSWSVMDDGLTDYDG